MVKKMMPKKQKQDPTLREKKWQHQVDPTYAAPGTLQSGVCRGCNTLRSTAGNCGCDGS